MLNKQHLPLLLAARQILDEGREKFICYALDTATLVEGIQEDLADDAREVITDGIDGRSFFSSWLLDQVVPGWWRWTDGLQNVPEPYLSGLRNDNGVFLMARLAWLDKIIHDIEALPCAS